MQEPGREGWGVRQDGVPVLLGGVLLEVHGGLGCGGAVSVVEGEGGPGCEEDVRGGERIQRGSSSLISHISNLIDVSMTGKEGHT